MRTPHFNFTECVCLCVFVSTQCLFIQYCICFDRFEIKKKLKTAKKKEKEEKKKKQEEEQEKRKLSQVQDTQVVSPVLWKIYTILVFDNNVERFSFFDQKKTKKFWYTITSLQLCYQNFGSTPFKD